MPRRLSLVVLVLALLVGRAHSQTLYAVTSTGQLLTVDTSTGATTLRAAITPAMQPIGLGFRGFELYVADFATKRIYQVDPNTGGAIRIAVSGLSFSSVFGSEEGDITFRSDGAGFMSMGIGSRFSRFDVDLGSDTAIPGAPLAGQKLLDGLAFDRNGILYGLNHIATPAPVQFYTVNTTSGVFTPGQVAPGLPNGATNNYGGMAFHPQTDQLFVAIGGSPSAIFRVDVATGASVKISDIAFDDITGLSFSPPPVPPPSAWQPPPPPEGNFGTGTAGGEGGFGRLAIRERGVVLNVSGRGATESPTGAVSCDLPVGSIAAGVAGLMLLGIAVGRRVF